MIYLLLGIFIGLFVGIECLDKYIFPTLDLLYELLKYKISVKCGEYQVQINQLAQQITESEAEESAVSAVGFQYYPEEYYEDEDEDVD